MWEIFFSPRLIYLCFFGNNFLPAFYVQCCCFNNGNNHARMRAFYVQLGLENYAFSRLINHQQTRENQSKFSLSIENSAFCLPVFFRNWFLIETIFKLNFFRFFSTAVLLCKHNVLKWIIYQTHYLALACRGFVLHVEHLF